MTDSGSVDSGSAVPKNIFCLFVCFVIVDNNFGEVCLLCFCSGCNYYVNWSGAWFLTWTVIIFSLRRVTVNTDSVTVASDL